MPNTAASTLPALRRNVTGYLQARRNGPHAVAKPTRVHQPEARAHMPVVVLARAEPRRREVHAAPTAFRAKPPAKRRWLRRIGSGARQVMRFLAD